MTRLGLQQRLAAWADSRLLPAGVALLLAIDVAFGVNWLLSPPENLTSPAYRVAKQVTTMDVHGAVFVVCALLAAGVYVWRDRGFAAGWLVGGLLAALWLFWDFMFTLAPIGTEGGVSLAGSALATGLLLLHLLFGLALTHVPRRPERG